MEIIIPAARDEDVDDVQCALTVAHACAERGDADDAVKWLRRASRAAADHDDVGRAVELSKAASAAEAHAKSAAESAREALPPPAPAAPARQPATRAPTRIDRPTPRGTPSPRAPQRVARTPQPAARTPQPAAHRAPQRPAAERSRAPAQRPAPVPPQRPELRSDLERTEPRMVLPKPLPAPEEAFALPPLLDDDLDEPTETKQRPSAPRKSDTRATDPRASWDSDLGPLADELEPATCRVTDMTPLSATRVAVYPGVSGRPEVVFLPAGQRPPPGAAVALIVPTSPEDAALLAAMVRVFEHGRAAC